MADYDHKQRHKELHRCLDELAADYITATGRLTTETTVFELIEWSYRQTVDPYEKD